MNDDDLTLEQRLQVERTRQGLCARCGLGMQLHDKGQCPDGGGSYSWAHTRDETEQIVDRLQAALDSMPERTRWEELGHALDNFTTAWAFLTGDIMRREDPDEPEPRTMQDCLNAGAFYLRNAEQYLDNALRCTR